MQRDAVEQPLQPDYNVAPTKPVYAVLERAREADPGPERELRVLRWGLVPFWARDPKAGSRMINARAETVADKPAFRRAFSRRRCLLPADGYYEWQQVPGEARQPVYITPGDGAPLAFAGLYELWRGPEGDGEDPAGWLWTAAIITTSAPDELGAIHDRMPMIIGRDAWDDWLDPAATDPAQVRSLLVPAMTGGLVTYPVSRQVNSVRNNGPQLIEPAGGGRGGSGRGGGGALF